MPRQANFIVAVGVLFLITGCATTKNYQPDIDSLNSRITALQAQLSEKDQQIVKLKNQLGSQQSELKQAESEKRELMDKLSAASRQAPPKAEQSDLK